jgi:FtsZ-binding cell division protein ZapB
MTEHLRGDNHPLRAKITELLGRRRSLRPDVNAIASKQHANLQERARALVGLEDIFND